MRRTRYFNRDGDEVSASRALRDGVLQNGYSIRVPTISRTRHRVSAMPALLGSRQRRPAGHRRPRHRRHRRQSAPASGCSTPRSIAKPCTMRVPATFPICKAPTRTHRQASASKARLGNVRAICTLNGQPVACAW